MQHLVFDDLSVHALVDARPEPVPVTWSFPAVEEEEWSALECAGLDPQGRFAPSLGCFLVRMGGASILCDAGIGPSPNAYLGGLSGALPALLAELEMDAAGIDAVVFSHLHMDHIGWAGQFPNAAYYAPVEDFTYFDHGAPGTGQHHLTAFETCVRPLADGGKLALLDDDAEILPGLRYFSTPGHTPGHQSLLLDLGPRTLCITGDVFHCPAQIERPDWSHRADFDAAEARRSRHELIECASAENWILAAGHFRDGLQFGRIAPTGEGCVWRTETGAPDNNKNKNNRRSHAADIVSTTGG